MHMRLVLGNGWPPKLCAVGESTATDPISSTVREIMGAHGKYISVVDRLLDIRAGRPEDTVDDVAKHLVDSLRDRCGPELWASVRSKVPFFTPDGVAGEQQGLLRPMTSRAWSAYSAAPPTLPPAP